MKSRINDNLLMCLAGIVLSSSLTGSVLATRTLLKTEYYEVHEFRYVGLLQKDKRYQALVLSPSGEVLVVKQGFYVGKDYGYVTEITPEYILIREKLPWCKTPDEWGDIMNHIPGPSNEPDQQMLAERERRIGMLSKPINGRHHCLRE